MGILQQFLVYRVPLARQNQLFFFFFSLNWIFLSPFLDLLFLFTREILQKKYFESCGAYGGTRGRYPLCDDGTNTLCYTTVGRDYLGTLHSARNSPIIHKIHNSVLRRLASEKIR